MTKKIKIHWDIDPTNAYKQGYEWTGDIIYDPEAPKGAMDDIENAVLKEGCILGKPASSADNLFTGLYKKTKIPKKFISLIEKIRKLEANKHYLAAFLFGSAAREELNDDSDLDVIVMTDNTTGIEHVLHPTINSVKLDISFNTFKQIVKNMEEQIAKNERLPMICESTILFDKTGKLSKYKRSLEKIKPCKLKSDEIKWCIFMPLHINSKIKKFIKTDPTQTLLIMHDAVGDLLKRHYRLNRKWRLSDKRLLPDLKSWDPIMAQLVEKYVHQTQLNKKYRLWQKMLNHVIAPFGGDKGFEQTNCKCKICQKNLSNLL